MLNVSERPSSSMGSTSSVGSAMMSPSKRLLGAWLGPSLGWTEGKVQVKQRGNVLHVLCEGEACPDRTLLTKRLQKAIAASAFVPKLVPDGATVHRLVLYGKITGQAKPSWGETFELFELNHHGSGIGDPSDSTLDSIPHTASTSAPEISANLSRQSEPRVKTSKRLSTTEISHHLSRHLSQHNVTVRVRRGPFSDRSDLQRLVIICESVYSPDPNLIAEPLAQCLRELALRDCQDALISGQVKGETEPDWVVRVDLTPADQMLRSRAQWGDMVAMEYLLTQLLQDYCQGVEVSMDQTTLHVVCRHDRQVIPQMAVVKAISEFLTELVPQGIKNASLYGVLKNSLQTTTQTPTQAKAQTTTQAATQETTQWVHWLDLPGMEQVDLAVMPEDLARRGNLTAIGQLLTRQLNPDLQQQLSTGGIRVRVRQRDTVLHVMTDALIPPQKDQVTQRIRQYLLPLGLEGLTGLCVYGRRAGQSQPSWQQGIAIVPGVKQSQKRLVPESVPEFTASDAYVEDLLTPSGEIVFVPRKVERNWGEAVEKLRQGTRSILLKTPFFSPVMVNQRMVMRRDEGMDGRVAVVWGLLGVSLIVTGDWAIGLVLRTQAPVDVAQAKQEMPTSPKSDALALSSIALNRSSNVSDASAFNASDFTQGKENRSIIGKNGGSSKTDLSATGRSKVLGAKLSAVNLSAATMRGSMSGAMKFNPSPIIIDPGLDANLPSSPLQPKAAVDPNRSPYPKLNSPQLDERLALYQQYISVYGVPDVLVVGSSRALRGIDPSELQESLAQNGYGGQRVFNFGVNGATAQVVDLILRRLIAPEQLPKTIIWADGARAFNSGRTDVTFNAIAASPGYRKLPAQPINPKAPATAQTSEPLPQTLADRYQSLEETLQGFLDHLSAGGQNREEILRLARERILGNPIAKPASNDNGNLSSTGEGLTDTNGFLSLSNQFNPATYYQKYSKVSGAFDSDYDSFQLQGRQQDSLKAIAEFANSRNISLVFVNLPTTVDYLDSRRSEYETEFQKSMTQESQELKFTYRDLSKTLDQQNALFSDPSHLNRYGAYVVTQRLAQDSLMPWKKSP